MLSPALIPADICGTAIFEIREQDQFVNRPHFFAWCFEVTCSAGATKVWSDSYLHALCSLSISSVNLYGVLLSAIRNVPSICHPVYRTISRGRISQQPATSAQIYSYNPRFQSAVSTILPVGVKLPPSQKRSSEGLRTCQTAHAAPQGRSFDDREIFLSDAGKVSQRTDISISGQW